MIPESTASRMKNNVYGFTFLVSVVGLAVTACNHTGQPQAWPPLEPADFSAIDVEDFDDHELDVPYFLFHFAQVANAVREEGEHRGFLDLKVNHDPEENHPRNARVMEMQMALAYFYGAERAWNPYQGDPAVRMRLEAMLDRWVRIQNPDGLFTGADPGDGSLGATSFGAMSAARTLEILIASKQPFDQEIIDNARQSLRRALMALFTREDIHRHPEQWSDEFNGSYYAGAMYLNHWPDDELDAAFTNALAEAPARDQSPAGYHFEYGGPDFGYPRFNDTHLRVALPHLRAHPDAFESVLASNRLWNDWLAANYVPQPEVSRYTFFINAGINTRTYHAYQYTRVRPLAEFVEKSAAFSRTRDERAEEIAAQRESLAGTWGDWDALSVPSYYSYRPRFVHDAWSNLDTWQPDDEQRAAALAQFPHMASDRFNRQYHDPLPLTVTTVRRPDYFGIFNSGENRVPRQRFGLGLLWHPTFGVALQSVAGTEWLWGTRSSGDGDSAYEQDDLHAAISAGGNPVESAPGTTELPSGPVIAEYPLADQGEKTITFNDSGIAVEISHRETFTEFLPLVMPEDASIEREEGRVVVRRDNGSSFTVHTSTPNAEIFLAEATPLAEGLVRRLLTIEAEGALTYQLGFK